MNFDCILANSPYGSIGVDITHHLMNHQKQAQMSMLGNISMFKRYADRMAIQLVQIGAFEYGTNKRLPWGVEQAIFTATTNGYTVVIKNKLSGNTRNVSIPNLETTVFQTVGTIEIDGYARLIKLNSVIANVDKIVYPAVQDIRQAQLIKYRDVNCIYTKENHTIVEKDSSDLNLYKYNHTSPCMVKPLNNETPTVEMAMGAINRYEYNDTRAGVIQNRPLCRPGRVYRVFDTAEEAYECALDLVSWKNPTDSHDRCVKWGFITDYQPHYIWEN